MEMVLKVLLGVQNTESQGFKVVSGGNADNFDYDTTTIKYPKDKRDDAENS